MLGARSSLFACSSLQEVCTKSPFRCGKQRTRVISLNRPHKSQKHTHFGMHEALSSSLRHSKPSLRKAPKDLEQLCTECAQGTVQDCGKKALWLQAPRSALRYKAAGIDPRKQRDGRCFRLGVALLFCQTGGLQGGSCQHGCQEQPSMWARKIGNCLGCCERSQKERPARKGNAMWKWIERLNEGSATRALPGGRRGEVFLKPNRVFFFKHFVFSGRMRGCIFCMFRWKGTSPLSFA